MRELFIALLLLLTGAGLAPAQGPAAPGSAAPASAAPADDPAIALHTTIGPGDRLTNLWKLRRARLANGEAESAAETLEQIDAVKRDRGIARLDGLAISLIREAEAAAADGKADLARDRLVSADRVAPGLPGIDEARARIALDLQPWAIHRWLQYKVKSIFASLADFQYRALLLADVALTFMIVVLGVALIFLLGQLLRYGVNLYYDLGTAFPQVMRIALIAAGALLFVLPFWFGFGPLIILFPIALLVWPYQSGSERLLAVVLIGLLGAAPWMLRMADRLTEAGTGLTQALHALSLDPGDARAMRVVARRVKEVPQDWHAKAVLGMAHKRHGQVPKALGLLRAAAEAAPQGEAAATVRNNLGNALFAAGRAAEAEAAYEAALQLNGRAAEPQFNLHRLYRRMGRREAAAEAINVATQLDREAVSRWNQDDDLGLNRYVVDMPLPASLLTRRAFADLFAPTPLATRAWVLFAGPLPELTAPLGASITLLGCIALVGMRRRLRLSWPCARTGRPVQTFMVHGRPELPLDDEYVAVFLHNKPIDRSLRFKLEATVGRWEAVRRWGTRLCGLVPGLLGMVRGRPIWGAILAGVSVLLALRLIMPEGVLLDPVTINRVGGERWIFIGLLGVIWLYGMIKAIRWHEAGR